MNTFWRIKRTFLFYNNKLFRIVYANCHANVRISRHAKIKHSNTSQCLQYGLSFMPVWNGWKVNSLWILLGPFRSTVYSTIPIRKEKKSFKNRQNIKISPFWNLRCFICSLSKKKFPYFIHALRRATIVCWARRSQMHFEWARMTLRMCVYKSTVFCAPWFPHENEDKREMESYPTWPISNNSEDTVSGCQISLYTRS